MRKFFGDRSNKDLAQELAVGPAPDPIDLDPSTEKQLPTSTDDDNSITHPPSEEAPSEDAQDGVKKVEAVTLTWTRKELYVAYGW
jgi:hypothetical protein